MKWIEIENYDGDDVYIPETAVKSIVFYSDSVTIHTEKSTYIHRFRKQPKDETDDCEHRFSRWLSNENADWQVFFFTSF